MSALLIAVLAFCVMEPLTAATHRWVMHGIGWVLHRSHHQVRPGRFEANDAFPVMFAAIVCLGLVVGFNLPGWGALVPAGLGVTAYGIAYGLVHDVAIHGRVLLPALNRSRLIAHLAEAHRIHHLFNGAPYGMLLPVVPASLRARAAATDRDPLRRAPIITTR